MALDPARAGFVLSEFRYEAATDNSVKSLYPTARVVEIGTSFSQAVAQSLAAAILAETKVASEGYKIPIEGIFTIEDLLEGGPARYTMTAPTFNVLGRIMKLVAFDIDPWAGITTLTVRG